MTQSPRASKTPPPRQLRLSKDRQTLTVEFPDGESFAIPAEILRVLSPSAEVQGHSPEQRQLVQGKRLVRISGIEPVGNYAVRIIFDDGHSTGIYIWAYLHELGSALEEKIADYEAELAQHGLSRDV